MRAAGGGRRPGLCARGRSVGLVVTPASKRPSRGGGDNNAKLPSNVRVTPDGVGSGSATSPPPSLSDRERALLDAAVRDSQQVGTPPKKARPVASNKRGFGGAPAAAAAAAATATPKPPPSVRPVDAREAARGRVELVNVRSWGGGGSSGVEAGDLEVVSVRTLVGGGGAGGDKQSSSSAGAGAASAAPSEPPPLLHVALAQQLQLAEARGALSIAGSRELPPFERWSFSERSYAQYLADHAEAHAALDDALDAAVATAGDASAPHHHLAALRWFCRSQGLARGDAYRSDLQAMVATATTGAPIAPPPPTNGAAALARLLRRLGRDAVADHHDAEPALKLAAHAYALRAAHFSGSGRITAAAEARLQLAWRGALAAVARYGPRPSSSSSLPPPAAFQSDVDDYGHEMSDALGDGGGEPFAWAAPMFAELPAAFRKASALLDGLAVEEEEG
jgi:hypothetical protein